MGTTNSLPHPLLPFFERLTSREGIAQARTEFKRGERHEEWGFLVYNSEAEALQGAFIDWPESGDLTSYEVRFVDWLSQQVRPEADRVLVEFGELLAYAQSEEEVESLRRQYVEEIKRLKRASASRYDPTVHDVVSTALQRIEHDIGLLVSGPDERRRRRGGRKFNEDVDQEEIERVVAQMLQVSAYWHRGKRQGPNINRIANALEHEHADLFADVEPGTVIRRVKRVVADFRRKGLLAGPQGESPDTSIT
jgi:hypothetical protein